MEMLNRTCPACGMPMVIRAGEGQQHFDARMYCNHGCAERHRKAQRAERTAAMAERYKAGDTMAEIAIRFNCSRTHVGEVVAEYDLRSPVRNARIRPGTLEGRVETLARSLASQAIIPIENAERIVRAVAICCRRVPSEKESADDVHEFGEALGS